MDQQGSPPSATPAYEACKPSEKAWVDQLFLCGLNQTEASRRLKPDRSNAAAEKHGQRMSRNVRVQAAIKERLARAGMGADEIAFLLAEHARGTAADWLSFETVQRREKVWVPVGVAIEEKRLEADVEREAIARMELDGKARDEADAELAKLERELVRLEVLREKDPSRVVQIDGPLIEEVAARIDLAKLQAAGKLHLVKSVKQDKDGMKVELYDAQAALDKAAKIAGAYGAKGTADDPVHVEHRVTQIVFTTPEAGQAPARDDD